MRSSRPQPSLAALILAASVASTIGGLPFNSLPVMLGSLADSFALPSEQVGLIGSVCFAGYLAGTLGAPIWMNRLNWRVLTLVSAVCTAASFAISAQVSSVTALYVMWALIGFFASTMTCLGMRVLADLPNKERAFGVRQGVELSVTAAALFILPPLIIAPFHYPGAALALATLVAVLGLSAWWVPEHPLRTAAISTQTREKMPARAWLTLAVFGLFLIGNIGLWAFLERIGSASNVGPAEMGLVFAVLKLLGGVAAFSVAAVGYRLPAGLAYTLVLAGVALGLALMGGASSFLPYAAGVWLWEFAFTCGCVFQTAGIARSESSGRAVMLIPAVFAFSSMAGPGMAGQIAAGGSFGGLLGVALASTLVPVLAHLARRLI